MIYDQQSEASLHPSILAKFKSIRPAETGLLLLLPMTQRQALLLSLFPFTQICSQYFLNCLAGGDIPPSPSAKLSLQGKFMDIGGIEKGNCIGSHTDGECCQFLLVALLINAMKSRMGIGKKF